MSFFDDLKKTVNKGVKSAKKTLKSASNIDSIPVLSQAKSLAQAVTGDTKGARKTQDNFSKQAPVVAQIRSAAEAASGDTKAARKTQEEFLNKLKSRPGISQGVSAVQWISGDSKAAKETQAEFFDQNVKVWQDIWRSAIHDDSKQLETSTHLTARPNWMQQFPDSTIFDLLIPGTHDSAAYEFRDVVPPVQAFAQTQALTILQQLRGGIRFLDIRVTKSGGIPYTSHSFLAVPLADVLNDIKRFVDENPSEIVVMWVQEDDGDLKLAEAKDLADDAFGDRYVHAGTLAKPIGQFPANENIVYLDNNDPNDLSLERVNSWNDTKDADPVRAVMNCIAWARKKTRKSMKLNLLACQATPFTGGTTDKIAYVAKQAPSAAGGIEDGASYSNFVIKHALLPDADVVGRSNIINMDFANDELIDIIIAKNKKGVGFQSSVALRVRSVGSGRVLDVYGGSHEPGTNIIQWQSHGKDNQRFVFEPTGDGSFFVRCVGSGMYLDVFGSSVEASAKLIQWHKHGGDNQRFFIDDAGNGHVFIRAKHSGHVLDVFGGSRDNGAQIIQYPRHGGDNQRFEFHRK